MRRWLNPLGLIFGMIGVVIIFIWGPPQPSFQKGEALVTQESNVLPNGQTVKQRDAEIAAKERHYKHLSQVGLIFVFVGFACQLGAVWPRRCSQ
jgi:hypothetical protein